MSPKPTPREEAAAVDRHVGIRLRALRSNRGVTLTALGRHLGVTFAQVQKHENGSNRISAGRLYQMAKFFGVPVGWFFEGLE